MYYYSPFRNTYKATPSGCPFCNAYVLKEQSIKNAGNVTVENEHYTWLVNMYPKFEGHTLIVPKRHITEFGQESAAEVAAREEILVLASNAIRALYPGAGIEYFIQTGDGSESSIKHLHYHLVPAQKDDPIRGFDKLGQFFTIEQDKEKVIFFPVPIKLAQKELANALSTVLSQKEITNESGFDGGWPGHTPRSPNERFSQ